MFKFATFLANVYGGTTNIIPLHVGSKTYQANVNAATARTTTNNIPAHVEDATKPAILYVSQLTTKINTEKATLI